MSLVFAAPALPLHKAGPYVVAAYIAFIVLILVYVAIMALRLTRNSAQLAQLKAELDARRIGLDDDDDDDGGKKLPTAGPGGGSPARARSGEPAEETEADAMRETAVP